MRGLLVRCQQTDDRMLGWLLLFKGLSLIGKFATLEPPWRGNARAQSCIPPGNYTAAERRSAKFGLHLHIQNVPNRDWILMHAGNDPSDTMGCVLVGYRHDDLDGDGVKEVVQSKLALDFLLNLLDGKGMTLTIVDKE